MIQTIYPDFHRHQWGQTTEENPFKDHVPDPINEPRKFDISGRNRHEFLGEASRDKSPYGVLIALEKLGVLPYYNLRSLGFEIQRHDVEVREILDKEKEAYLRSMIRTNFCFLNTKRKTRNNVAGTFEPLALGRDEFFDALFAICAHYPDRFRGDPFKEYYRSLPAWDGHGRLNGFIEQFFSIDEAYLDVAKWASRFLFLGPIHRAENPGAKLDTAPILAGDSHLGKSTLVNLLFPAKRRNEWFTDDFSLVSRDSGKDQIESTLGTVIVEISEMVGYRKTDIDTLKAMLSRKVDKKRLAYRRDPEPIPRRFVFVGTSNDLNCIPNDPSNALKRRLPVIPVSSRGLLLADLIRRMDQIRDQLWAEAWHRFQQGEVAALIGEVEEQVIRLGENHRMADDELENALAEWETNLPSGLIFKRLRDIAIELRLIRVDNFDMNNASSNLNWHVTRSLSTALRNRGWKSTSKKIEGVLVRGWELLVEGTDNADGMPLPENCPF